MTAPALELRSVWKSFGPAEIIRGVDLSISKGERHAIIGPNGAGKSTLFNLISGSFPPTAGDILLNGQSIAGLPAYAINRRGLSRSFQVTSIFHNLPVIENIRCAVLWAQGHRFVFWKALAGLKDVEARAAEIMELTGLAHARDVPAGLLSYGDQRALEIGITIAGGAEVIMLDEPTAGMSRHETERAIALIRRVTEGRTLAIVEHDMNVVFGLADKISVLVYGEIIASGPPDQIRGDPKVKAAYLGEDAA